MKKYFIILGHPFTKISVYITITLITFMVVAIVSSSYFVIAEKQGQNPSSIEDTRGTSGDPDAASNQALLSTDPAQKAEESILTANPNSLVEIVTTHIKATGFDKLKSFTSRATPLNNSEQRDIIAMGLHPNFYKFTINYRKTRDSVKFGYNGEEKWINSNSLNRTFPNEARDKNVVLILSSLPHLAWTYNSSKSSLEGVGNFLTLMPEKIRNGRNCYVIRSRKLLPFEMDHYIDTETFHEIYRTATLQNTDGSAIEIGVEFDQTKIDESSQLPLYHKVYEDGKLIDELIYETPRTNITLMSALFAPPSEPDR